MNNDVLKISSRPLKIIFITLSVLMLLRGHNQPGGGFIGGILLAAGFILYGMANGVDMLRKNIKFQPVSYILTGLFAAAFAALPGAWFKETFFEGIWLKIDVINLKLGTPLLFDVGVYLTVFGVLMMIFSTIMEELKWN